jgi:ribosomal-protein-alanine N-acetyltransferase
VSQPNRADPDVNAGAHLSAALGKPILETPRLRLRLLADSDAAAMHKFYGDSEVMRYWDSLPSRDIAETADHIRRSRELSTQVHGAFAVTFRDCDCMIGMVNYHDRRLQHRRLSVGWLLAKPWWRQKIMSEAMAVFLVYCFDHLDAHRIEARIEPGNIASMRLAKRLGFEREGLMRDRVFVGDQPRSQYLWALLCPNWRRRIAILHDQAAIHVQPTWGQPTLPQIGRR